MVIATVNARIRGSPFAVRYSPEITGVRSTSPSASLANGEWRTALFTQPLRHASASHHEGRIGSVMATARKSSSKKYSKKAQSKVGKVMREYKEGKLKSGGKSKVKSRKQAIAIGISEARKSGAKVPKKKAA
jgi:hypothetical protein